MTNPLGMTSLEALVQNYNSKVVPAKQVNLTDFYFGLPEPVAVAGHPGNTRLTITPKPGFSRYGRITVYYHRINLATVSLDHPAVITQGNAVTVKDVIEALNTLYNLDLTDEDYLDTPLTTGTLMFAAAPNSTKYVGAFTVKVVAGQPMQVVFENEISVDEYARLMEDGSVRLMEDGSVRYIEHA